MSERSMRVVGMSPGARWTGIAAVQGDLLFRFDIVTTGRYLGRTRLLRQRLARILAELAPDLVVLEALGMRRAAPELREIERVIVAVAAERGIPLRRESLPAARRHVAEPERPTRAVVHHRLVGRFPQLERSTEARPGARWWSGTDRYWERAFAALALALHGQPAGIVESQPAPAQ